MCHVDTLLLLTFSMKQPICVRLRDEFKGEFYEGQNGGRVCGFIIVCIDKDCKTPHFRSNDFDKTNKIACCLLLG